VGLQRLDALVGKRHAEDDGRPVKDHFVLMRVGASMRALAVESLIGRREIVIKPLSPLFRGIHGFSGAPVLGDGRVALILDPRTLFSLEA
jgi:chemotaxis protein histidine kinase CheA